ncbi:MAG TPA: hypothetical protein VN834_01910 [Candidatus Acidoferrum sp.]|nr:hypothetical protein [Candidatus Acidoferrum sp.]
MIDAEQLRSIRERNAAVFQHRYEGEQRRDRADREAAEERRARQQSHAEAMQRVQVAWAEKRNEFQAEVDEMRRLLTSARGNIVSESLADARLAVADAAIYERRLDLAERALATHKQAQPAGY